MPNRTVETEVAQEIVESRRARVLEGIERMARPVLRLGEALPGDRIEHLVRDAAELYWNELAWEELTDEERISGGHLTELVFPGFLAYIEGLLVERVPEDSQAPAQPRPEAVESILLFLAGQLAITTAKLEGGADAESLVWARVLTSKLIDLVLYRLYRLTAAEAELLEGDG